MSSRQPELDGRLYATVEDRFMAKVTLTDTCWLWDASVISQGYGRFWFEGKTRQAHRVSYVLFVGPLSDDLTVDHVKARGCTSKLCVNPDHLEAVSIKENCIRRSAEILACPQGHVYDEKNTRVDSNGWRHCRRCRADLAKRRRKMGKS